jgi:hypothetical protein
MKMAKRLPRATMEEIKKFTGKIVNVDCGSYYNTRLIKKAKVNKVKKTKTVGGELVFEITILDEKYTKTVYESELVI